MKVTGTDTTMIDDLQSSRQLKIAAENTHRLPKPKHTSRGSGSTLPSSEGIKRSGLNASGLG